MFYEFNQNNSFGHFDVDDILCHRIVIEADSEEEAIAKAENLGCYWDGVEHGIDCPCCGDRWYASPDEINEESILNDGIVVDQYVGIYGGRRATMNRWKKLYGKYKIVEEPTYKTQYGSEEVVGKIAFKNIEEYIQYMVNEWGYSFDKYPDTRIFYKDDVVKEFYKNN